MITYGSTTLTSYNSIVNTEVYYYKSTSPTALSGGSWSTTKPTWESGKYVWQKIRTIYEDETYTESDPVNITGQQGATGDAAYSYKLNASDTAVTVSKTGEYSVNKITFTATYKQGTGAVTAYAGRFKIETTLNGTTWTTAYTSSGNESSKEYTIPTNIIAIRCSLYQAGGTSVLLDITTIPIVKDGIDAIGLRDSIPYYLASDKQTGVTRLDQGWTRFKPELTTEKRYLWVYYVSRYSEGDTQPELIEIKNDVINFENHGDESPVEDCIIDINPVQDLHGYDSPWIGGNGKNLLSPLIKGVAISSSTGAEYDSETSASTDYIPVSFANNQQYQLSEILNTLNNFVAAYNSNKVFLGRTEGSNSKSRLLKGDSFTAGTSQGTGDIAYLRFTIYEVSSLSGVIDDIDNMQAQLEQGSTITEYEPYENICPISGWTNVKINASKKNLFNKDTVTNDAAMRWANAKTDTETGSWVSDYIPFIKNTNYKLNYNTSQIFIFDDEKNAILIYRNGNTWTALDGRGGGGGQTFTTPNKGTYLRFCYRRSGSTSAVSPDLIQLELGTTSTTYEPYQGNIYNIQFPSEAGTVYGGTLDVTTGRLTVDKVSTIVVSNDLSNNGSLNNTYKVFYQVTGRAFTKNVLCNYFNQDTAMLNYMSVRTNSTGIEFTIQNDLIGVDASANDNSVKLPAAKAWFTNNPVQLVYELAEPIIYQLTPQEITMLTGQNYIFSNAGQTAISYYDNQTSTDPYVDHSATSAFEYSVKALAATQPLYTKTYTGLIGSANDAANASFYFAKIHPTSYTINYKVKMKVQVTEPEAYAETIDIQLGGYGSTFSSYDSYTIRTGSIGIYYINLYRATQAGISTNHKGHALGVGLRSSTNPTDASYKRTIIVDILELENCTIEMLDTAVKYANIDGTGSTNYSGLTEMYVATAGQNATNNTNTHYTQYASAVKAGTFGVKRYTLIMKETESTWSSFVNQANSIATTKTANNNSGYLLGKLLYSAGGAEYTSGTNTSTIYDAYPIDFRYSSNCGTALVANKPVYLIGTVHDDGKFYFDVDSNVWYTQEPVAPSVPMTSDGKVYIYVGMAYSTYQVWLSTENPAYTFYNGEFILYDKATTLQDIKSLEEDLQSQIDGKIQTFYQSTNPASSWTTTELRTPHDGDLWYYTGTSTSTYTKDNVYRYNASNNTWSVYSASGELFDKVDGKSTIYYGTTSGTYTGVETGDYLVDSTDGSSYRWDGSKWVKVTDYKTTITNAIDNIQIGGRNLALDSSLTGNIQKWNPTDNRWIKTIKDGHECLMCEGSLNTTATLTVPLTINSESYGVVPYNGLQLVFSADVLLEDIVKGTTNYFLTLYPSGQTIDGTWRGATILRQSEYLDNASLKPSELNGIGWTRFWRVFKYGDYNWSAYVRPTFYARDFTGKVYIKNIKVEYGDYATDWTPAPEDVTRGTGFYSITTAPTAYTTTTGDFTPAYRITLSTVKTESGLNEVMIGDVIQQGYNTYPVGYVDASYVYLGTANSIRGATGATGLNNAQVILYRRFASAPSGTNVAPTGDVTYTFATGKAVNNLNSWTQNIPSGSDPVYMIAASASSTSSTDTIPKTEWSAPVKILENGQDGGTGSAGADGYNQATIFLYQRKSGTAPSKPSSAVTYTFSTGALSSVPTGWSRTIPVNDGNPCYVTTAVAFAKTTTYSIPASGWSDVVVLSQDGADGTSITITSTSVKYQKGTSGTAKPTGTWGTTIPSLSENEFLWTQTIVNYSDGSSTEAYSVSRNAKNGTDGTSPTVSSTVVEYQQSTGGTTPPTGTWSSTAPTATAGQYMWTRTTVKYSDNKTAVSYSVSKNGTNGTSPTAYHLIVSHGAINKSQAGVYNPTTITLTSKSQTGNGALNNYNGRFKIETTTDNSTWTQDSASSTADESSKTYTIPANIKAVRFSLYLAGGFTTLLDQQTVPIVIDGAKGDNGEDAYTIVLTNEAHTFPAGVSAALAGSATSNVMTYKGGVQVACFVGSTSSATSISTGTTGLTCAINNNNSKNVSLTFTATTSLTTRAGTVTIPITVDNKSFSKTFTWSLANQGAKGDNGVSVTNVTSTNNTADGGTSVVTITLSDGTTKTFNVKNGTTGATGATAQWYYGTALTHTSGTATLVATSTSGAVVGSMYLNTKTSLVYKCTVVGTNNTWTYAGDLTTGVIDNIEIGGRNLFINKNSVPGFISETEAISAQGSVVKEYTSEFIPVSVGDKYVLQAWVPEVAGTSNQMWIAYMFYTDNTGATGTKVGSRIAKYGTAGDTYLTYDNIVVPANAKYIRVSFRKYNNGLVKLEKGNKATDWTPAPEDTDASIQQVQDNLDNLKIGGRNLLKNSKALTTDWVLKQATVSDGIVTITPDPNSSDTKRIYQIPANGYWTWTVGQEYTVSIDARSDSGAPFNFVATGVGINGNAQKSSDIVTTSTWTRYSFTFTVVYSSESSLTFQLAGSSNKTIQFKEPKLEYGGKATDWTPAPEDTQADIDTAIAQSVEYIIGTQTAATGTWTGRASTLSELKDGTQIRYWLPYAGSGNATLNLTLKDGTSTGAIPVYRQGGSANSSGVVTANRVTTHFPAGTSISMVYGINRVVSAVYSGTTYTDTFTGWFADGAYDSGNTYNRIRMQNAITAVTAITASRIICGTILGYKNIGTGIQFDLSYPLLYAGSAITAGNTGDNNYLQINGINASNNGTIQSGGTKKELYLKGTITGNTFTIASSPFMTTVIPTSADDFYYIPLGIMSSGTSIYFTSSNRLYAYLDGAFQPVDIAAALKANSAYDTAVQAQSEIVQTRQTLSLQIRDISVGGANLFERTKTFEGTANQSTAHDSFTEFVYKDLTVKSANTITFGNQVVELSAYQYTDLTSNMWYSFSFYAKGNVDIGFMYAGTGNAVIDSIDVSWDDNTYTGFNTTSTSSNIIWLTPTSNWQRYSVVFHIEEQDITALHRLIGLYARPVNGYTELATENKDILITETGTDVHLIMEGNEVQICGYKLELGNKPTDWTPADNDKATYDNIISQINLSKEGIAIRADKIRLEGMITANEGFSIDKYGNMTANNGTFNGIFESYATEINENTFDLSINNGHIQFYNNDRTLTEDERYVGYIGGIRKNTSFIEGTTKNNDAITIGLYNNSDFLINAYDDTTPTPICEVLNYVTGKPTFDFWVPARIYDGNKLQMYSRYESHGSQVEFRRYLKNTGGYVSRGSLSLHPIQDNSDISDRLYLLSKNQGNDLAGDQFLYFAGKGLRYSSSGQPMRTGYVATDKYIVTQYFSLPDLTIAKNTSQNFTIDVSRDGYTPIMCIPKVGGGQNAFYLSIYTWSMSGNIVTIRTHNNSSTSDVSNVTISLQVLYKLTY